MSMAEKSAIQKLPWGRVAQWPITGTTAVSP